jgi:DNA-binding NtrC family response regulator
MHFIAQSARRLNRPPSRVTQAVLSQLAAHDWPGNVRELQNVVERAVILSQGGPLRVNLQPTERRDTHALPPNTTSAQRLVTREELKRQERENILRALRASEGRIFGAGGAAELLGMKPTTLASRIKALGLKKNEADRG